MESKKEFLQAEIDRVQAEIERVKSEIDAYELSDDRADELYSNMLDDCYGEIDVCGYSYPASKVLEDVDPTAYQVGKNDYLSDYDFTNESDYQALIDELEDLESELEDLEND